MSDDEVYAQFPQFFRAGEDLEDDDFLGSFEDDVFLAPADELLGFEE